MTTQEKPSIARALRDLGTNVHEWSRDNHFPRSNVYRVISDWIEHPERRGRLPIGGFSQNILRALQKTLGPDVVPLNDQEDTPTATDQAA